MQQGESSVEEILESIKKVIARDNRDEALAARRRRTEEGMTAEPAPEPVPEPADADEAEEVLELGESEMVADEPTDDFDIDNGDNESESDESDNAPLIADNVRDSMRQNFAALSMLSEPGTPPQIVRSGETSLEGLTRELLRPMLAEWLDAKLPAMVERMVKAEIARIASKGG